MKQLSVSAGVFALAAALAACGGSGGGSLTPAPVSAPPPPPPPPPPVTSTSTITSGSVVGFSSIVVDGVVIQINNDTVFAIEGENEVLGDESIVKLGMIVTARSEEDGNGNLLGRRFEIDDGIRGIVENVTPDPDNLSLGTFRVAGQTIIVDGNTIFDDDFADADGNNDVDIRDLDPSFSAGGFGLVVEISGFPTEFGAIATRIDDTAIAPADLGSSGDDEDNVQVVGFVDFVDGPNNLFRINGATFFVNAATELDDDITIDGTLIGRFVEVEADIDSSGNFNALEVEDESDLDDFFDEDFGTDDDFDIEGILQSVDVNSEPNLIVINGVQIFVQDARGLVEFVGQRVEIEGEFNANRVLVLDEVEIEAANSVEIEDEITSIDATTNTLTTRLGVSIQPTSVSRLDVDLEGIDEEERLTPTQFIGLIGLGDRIEARGIPATAGIVWTRIEVDEDDDQSCRLQGPVDAGTILDPSFDILGVEIDTTGLEDDDFESDDGDGRASFFGSLTSGEIVSAESDDAGLGCSDRLLQTLTDGEVSIEDDDDIAGNVSFAGNSDDDSDDINTLELEGTIQEIDAVANTFVVAGTLISITPDTLIDASLVEEARGEELDDDDQFRFGDLPETIDELLSNGEEIEVTVDAQNNALKIEADD